MTYPPRTPFDAEDGLAQSRHDGADEEGEAQRADGEGVLGQPERGEAHQERRGPGQRLA